MQHFKLNTVWKMLFPFDWCPLATLKIPTSIIPNNRDADVFINNCGSFMPELIFVTDGHKIRFGAYINTRIDS